MSSNPSIMLSDSQLSALKYLKEAHVVGKKTPVRLDTAHDLERMGLVTLAVPTLAFSRAGQAKARLTLEGFRVLRAVSP